jgi:hypothetical protein
MFTRFLGKETPEEILLETSHGDVRSTTFIEAAE